MILEVPSDVVFYDSMILNNVVVFLFMILR